MNDKQLQRFISRYEVDATGCWLWTWRKTNKGYGIFYCKGERSAHRISYLHYKGLIPEGLELDHLCRKPACVNPDHLEAVTHRENILRSPIVPMAINATVTHCPKGHPYEGYNLKVEHGSRLCRECRKEVDRKRYKRNPRKRLQRQKVYKQRIREGA